MENLNGQLRRLVDELVHRGLSLEQARREFERQYIVSSLEQNECSIGRTAKALGIHRNTLRNKAATLGLDFDELRTELKGPSKDR